MNFILTRDKAITIAPAALKLSGIPDDAKLELTTLDGAVILTRSKMTAMEYVKLLTELTAHVGQMLLTCGIPAATATSATRTSALAEICPSRN